MIPVYPLYPLELDLIWLRLTFLPFGFFLFLGVVGACALCIRRARQYGIPALVIFELAPWLVVSGLFGAHFFDLLLYNSETFFSAGGMAKSLSFEGGKSSVGSIMAGALVFLVYTRVTRMDRKRLNGLTDAILQALVLGFMLGRIGCTLVHDHLGETTNFPLAFAFPEGPRHDLGFYEFLILALVIFPASYLCHRFAGGRGYQLFWVPFLYGSARFFLDFLRVGEARMWDLTPAQFVSLGFIVISLGYLRLRPRRESASYLCSPIAQATE